jgi:hypothetical protein
MKLWRQCYDGWDSIVSKSEDKVIKKNYAMPFSSMDAQCKKPIQRPRQEESKVEQMII